MPTMKSSFRHLFSLLVAAALIMTAASETVEAAEPAVPPAQAAAWLNAASVPPPLNVPASAAEWAKQRGDIRASLKQLLGDLPPRPASPRVTVLSREPKDGYIQEKFEFDN